MISSWAVPKKNLLAIETSSPRCIVAGCNKAGEIIEKISVGTQSHSEDILDLVDDVLKQLGVSVESLEGVVLGIGPGSFTGLRIGYENRASGLLN